MNTLFRIKKQQFTNNNSKHQFSPQFCEHLFPFKRTKIAWGCEQREQGWRGSDCTRLPRTWPVFDLGLAVTCGLNCLLVLYSAPRGFSPSSPVFPSPQKSTFPNSNSPFQQTAIRHAIRAIRAIRHAGGQAHYYSRTGTSKQRQVKPHWLRSLCFNAPS